MKVFSVVFPKTHTWGEELNLIAEFRDRAVNFERTWSKNNETEYVITVDDPDFLSWFVLKDDATVTEIKQ